MRPPTEWLRLQWGRWLGTPKDAALLEEHRRTVLVRAHAAAWIAVVVVPVTLWAYFQPYAGGALLGRAMMLAAATDVPLVLIILAIRLRLFDRRWELPFFLLAGICNATAAAMVQLSDAASFGSFLFPYFLILFGVAVLFPARSGWVLALVLLSPGTFAAGELIASGDAPRSIDLQALIVLVDAALIALVANRVTTGMFFREVESRLALERAHRQLQELDRAKSQFFANISHDLRNPLAVVTGPLSSLLDREGRFSAADEQLLRLAMKGADRLDALITDLLELAQLDAGVSQLHCTQVEVRSFVDELVKQSVPHALSLGIELVFHGPTQPVYAEMDVEKIERVLMNLLANALKFSDAQTTVTVEIIDSGEQVLIRVEDQGMGIAEEDLPRIFLRFGRGQGRAQREVDGSGLGLAVAKEFVDLHAGAIAVTSEVGGGSTFTVRLPKRVQGRACPPDGA